MTFISCSTHPQNQLEAQLDGRDGFVWRRLPTPLKGGSRIELFNLMRNNEKSVYAFIRATTVGKAKVMSNDDTLEAQRK